MNKYPIIKTTLFFIIGIAAQKIFPQRFEVLLLIALLILFLLLLFYLLIKERTKSLISLFLLFSYVLAGALIYSNFTSGLKPYPFEKLKYNGCEVYGKINSIELIKEGRVIFNAEIDSVNIESKMHRMNHDFIVRIYDEDAGKLKDIYSSLMIGGYFRLTGTIQRARDERNPGEFDYNEYLFSNNISGLISVYESENISLMPDHQYSFYNGTMNFFHQLRKGLDEEIQKYHSKKTSALLRGLLLGDYKKIDEESLENFVNAGVIHVLAVSGQHVALIILILFFVFNRTNVYLKYIFAVTGLVIFIFLTGMQVSVVRAVIMGLFFIAANLMNRDKNVYNILALSALTILIFNPNELFSPGFQLSYSAVLSIIFLYPKLKMWIDSFSIKKRILRNLLLFCAISLSAQIGTLPFTLAYFHKLSIAALVANIFVIPASGIMIYLGIVTLFAGLMSGWIAVIFASSNSTVSDITTWIVSLFGKSDFSFLTINQFSFLDALIYYLTLAGIITIINRFRNIYAKSLAVISAIAVMFLFMSLDNSILIKPDTLTIIGVDVGQGDATLIKFPDGKTGLIDAGNSFKNFSNGDKVILPLMNRMDIDHIDYTFITHLDADHYYGIYKLVEKGKIGLVYKPFPDSLNKDDIEFEAFLASHKCPVKYFSNQIIEAGNCRLYMLNHPALSEGLKYSSNNKSMILKIVYGNRSFLFTGDAGKGIEEWLVYYQGNFLRSDVLKAGHHGSKNSSSDSFVDEVRPELVFISAGIENRFHHPSPEVIEKYHKSGAKILRTDENGAVIISTDGNNLSVVDWKKKESRFIFDL